MLEVGKTYTLRNGLKTSPLIKIDLVSNYKFEAEVQEKGLKGTSVLCWLPSGRYLTNTLENHLDIIIK